MANFDPSTVHSSADIFSGAHTLPQIRAIHKSLHVQVEEKATRLRNQVGSSYRELLGTADTIVQMRGDNVAVQELLGQMGGRCGRGIVGAKVNGLAGFVEGRERRDLQEEAKVRLLDGCALVIGRLLKGRGAGATGANSAGGLEDAIKNGDRLVLAARLFVLSRLLTKSFSSGVTDSRRRQEIESANKTLRSLRNRLTRKVDRALSAVTEDSDRDDLLKTLCAYCLASSSGAKDALRYFLNVRARAMAFSLDIEEGQRGKQSDEVVKGLQLYTRSILDVQALVPSRLSQAVAGLKSRPLISEPALNQLDELRLDIYSRWCGDDIEYFTPFIRHDDLDGQQARDMLFDWAKKGEMVLLEGVKAAMAHMSEFKSVMELRTSLIQLWVREGTKAKGIDPTDLQDELRDVINERLLAVLENKVKKLRLVGSEVISTLAQWQGGVAEKHRDLWDEDGYEDVLGEGAAPFIEEVVSRLFGRNDAVSKALNCYRSWFHVTDDVREVVESLKKQRWDNDFDEIEDEETIEARQEALSHEDPKKLEQKLHSSLTEAFADLDKQLSELWEKNADSANGGAVAVYLLRVVRDIRSQLPPLGTVKDFGVSIVPSLQKRLADKVATKLLDQFAATGLSERKVITRPLWEGEPALPTQPSPRTFEFLRDLSTAMGEAGMDLWSPAATRIIKDLLTLRLEETWSKVLADVASEKEESTEKQTSEQENGDDKEEANGTEDGENNSEEQKQELYTQWVFDVAYLQHSLGYEKGPKAKDEGSAPRNLAKLEEKITKQSGLDEASQVRIHKSADIFWQRTKLLFGLLAE